MPARSALYTTGEFARLCGVKKQTLFHYDDIGLLRPVLVEGNGYRRYSHEQYHTFLLISCLKETGMSLADIRGYLEETNEERRNAAVAGALEALDRKIAHLERAREVIERAFAPAGAGAGAGKSGGPGAFETFELEETPVLASRDLTELDDRELVEDVAALVKFAEPFAACLRNADVFRGTCDDPVYLLVEDDPQLPDGDLAAPGLRRTAIPAGTYARYESRAETSSEDFYRAFIAELAERDLVAAGFFVEEYRPPAQKEKAPVMSAFVRVE